MADPIAVTLPGGYYVNGRCCREANVHPLNADDHFYLVEECRELLPAQWVTEVLTRCVAQLGPIKPVTREAIQSLTAGDREALLLHLRRLTWGDRLQCLLTCPSPECQEELEINLNTVDLLLSPYDKIEREYTLNITQEEGVSIITRFRLPTGGDQEAAATVARTDVAGAVDLLLQRCVHSVTSSDGKPVDKLTDVLGKQLEGNMAELDPQAEITLRLTCPACNTAFSVIFDTASYLIQELETGMRHLYSEIHLLAYHYHWSATEILQMSAQRRRKFLGLLEEELMQRAPQ